MASEEHPGPFCVTAGYELFVLITPMFSNQKSFSGVSRFPVTNSQVNRIVVTEDHKIAVATNPLIMIYDPQSAGNNRAPQFSGHMTNVTDIVFAGQQLYSCSEDRTWQSWDRRQGQGRAVKKGTGSSALNSLALHPSQQTLFTANEKGQVEMWDIAEAKVIVQHKVSQLPVRSIAITGDGSKIIAGCHDGNVCVLSTEGGGLTEIRQFRAHEDALLKLAVSPDGSSFVTTSADSTAKLWDLNSCTLKHQLSERDQKKWVWDAAFTSDGKFVCTGGTDKMCRTWNAETGELMYSSDCGHTKGITALAIYE